MGHMPLIQNYVDARLVQWLFKFHRLFYSFFMDKKGTQQLPDSFYEKNSTFLFSKESRGRIDAGSRTYYRNNPYFLLSTKKPRSTFNILFRNANSYYN